MTPSDASTPVATAPKILLAEDDDELRALFAETLRAAGFDVTETADGEAFLDALASSLKRAPDGRAGGFELVLADVRMPHFSALDVMFAARRSLAATPIVLVTAFADGHTQRLAFLLGASAVLSKPVKLEHLVATVRKLLRPPSQ